MFKGISTRSNPEDLKKNLTDPVCGMKLETWQVQYEDIYSGEIYSFCSSECHQTFRLFPKKFAPHV